MQNDCQIYVDPEEDEVFFGCVSEKEKTLSAKLVNHAVSSLTDDYKLGSVLDDCVVNVEDVEKRLGNRQSFEKKEAVVADESTDSPLPNEGNSEDITNSNNISNTSVELEHNYSTPMKHKIDKSILATPKSIVKADKDGGFLKVLSEIALVKAEAEGDSNSDSKKEDEDKENKMSSAIPEIKITEATPEKVAAAALPPNSISTELRRFRIIYNSPRNEDNVSQKPKSNIESFESERNFKNKLLDQEVEVLGSNRRKKSVDLIDFTESSVPQENDDKKNSNGVAVGEAKTGFDVIELTESPELSKKDNGKKESTSRAPVRFSKDARKIVEVLKKSTVDDTLNFTIPEINVEEEENSFLSPEPAPAFDDTVVSKPTSIPIRGEVASPKIPVERTIPKSKTEEKRTPVVSQTKRQPVKYFSERRICNEVKSDSRKCVKRLPLEDKRPATVEKANGMSQQVSSSRIPVFGVKNSKIPLYERVARPTPAKTTPSKTPSAKSLKNPKFNHIESPINAYINNKPTALVLNVKPEAKKEIASKAWKTTGNGKKVQEKSSQEKTTNTAIKLPFVDYKSATPYKIEKRPESRLPRLAPTVYKLIGSNSPKVLRHEGRFYMNSPRKANSAENTIVAEANEVSVVVSQPAQKSRTIK